MPDTTQQIAQALSKGAFFTTPRSTCVVIPDATRPLPFFEVLRPLLTALKGQPTTVLVGLGLHRPMTEEELTPVRRASAGLEVELLQHDPRAELVSFAHFNHIPIALNKALTRAERLICVGTVEPHQYAGYSGGIKAISIGCAAKETISAMHGLTFLRSPLTALGNITDNPFQEALWQVASQLSPAELLGLQVLPAPGQSNKIAAAFFGPLKESFQQACNQAEQLFFAEEQEPLDWLHLPVPAVKASNFYQASRAATYAALVDRPAIKEGAVILLEAACPEGIGTGTGERACAAAMARGQKDLLQALASGRESALSGGEQRAYVLARACQRNPIALIGAPPIAELASFGIPQFESLNQAKATLKIEKTRGKTINDVFHRVPRLKA